jgi:hypothetical protein
MPAAPVVACSVFLFVGAVFGDARAPMYVCVCGFFFLANEARDCVLFCVHLSQWLLAVCR